MHPQLATDPPGSAHPIARCVWCASALVIADVGDLRCWLCPRCKDRQMQWSLAIVDRKTGTTRVAHVPLPTQCALYELGAQGGNVLWGGRAGAAKSVGGRWWLYYRSLLVPGHESLLLRENWDQLQDNHTSKMAHEVPALGGRWFAGDVRAVFGKGSDEAVITCGHMADANSVLRYRGGNKGAILADEGSLYPVDFEGVSVLAELRTMARAEYVDRHGAVVKPVFAVMTNPGGPSAGWLKDLFIDHEPDFDRYPRLRPTFDDAGNQIGGYRPEQWSYIPASLDDNPYIAPSYRDENLSGLSEIRYRQLAEGDWSALVGSFFPEFSRAVHLIEGSFA